MSAVGARSKVAGNELTQSRKHSGSKNDKRCDGKATKRRLVNRDVSRLALEGGRGGRRPSEGSIRCLLWLPSGTLGGRGAETGFRQGAQRDHNQAGAEAVCRERRGLERGAGGRGGRGVCVSQTRFTRRLIKEEGG